MRGGGVASVVVVLDVVGDNAERRAGKFIDANFPAAVLRRRGKELLSSRPISTLGSGYTRVHGPSSYPVLEAVTCEGCFPPKIPV